MEWQRLARYRQWPGEISNRADKERLAAGIAERVESGQAIGVGSGSTSFLALAAIGERVEREGLAITTLPTSHEVALACAAFGLPVASPAERRPDWGFDGADEADARGRLIKGRGGAMFREKLVIASSPLTLILVDRTKLVTRLGERFAVPVETHPMALSLVEARLFELGATDVHLRTAGSGKDGPVITENGHLILDARFADIPDEREREIKAIPGVIESGLFVGYAVEVVVG